MVEKMCLWWWVVGALAVFMEWVDGCALARVCAGGGRFCWEEDHDDEADREGFADLACIFALFNYSSRWNMCDHGTHLSYSTLHIIHDQRHRRSVAGFDGLALVQKK
jgi:hypothetical protein